MCIYTLQTGVNTLPLPHPTSSVQINRWRQAQSASDHGCLGAVRVRGERMNGGQLLAHIWGSRPMLPTRTAGKRAGKALSRWTGKTYLQVTFLIPSPTAPMAPPLHETLPTTLLRFIQTNTKRHTQTDVVSGVTGGWSHVYHVTPITIRKPLSGEGISLPGLEKPPQTA